MPRRGQTKTRSEKGYQTNLASEFHILATLHRLGKDASLTLGNKKSVDIVILRDKSFPLTIDVKGVADKLDWLLGNISIVPQPNHFIVLVSFDGTIGNLRTMPRVWVFPHADLLPFVKTASNGKTRYVSRRAIINDGGRFEDAWTLLDR